jgi:hypothetical protein
LTVTSAVGNATVANWIIGTTAISSTSGTNIYIDNGGAFSGSAANRDVGAASVVMTAAPNNDWAGAATDVAAAAGGAACPKTLALMGVGC